MNRRKRATETISITFSISLLMMWFANTGVPQEAPTNARVESCYFPLSVGNSWLYALSGRQKQAMKTVRWSVTQREIINGSPVFHLWPTPPQGDEPLSLSVMEAGILQMGTERFLLKQPLQKGDRWIAKSRSLRAPGAQYTFEVISVGEACSVGQHSFADCVSVREIDEANNITSITTYAKGIGPVKYLYFKDLYDGVVETTLTIKSWTVH